MPKPQGNGEDTSSSLVAAAADSFTFGPSVASNSMHRLPTPMKKKMPGQGFPSGRAHAVHLPRPSAPATSLPGSPTRSRYCMADVMAEARQDFQKARGLHPPPRLSAPQPHMSQSYHPPHPATAPAAPYRPFPIVSFNHMSKEVLDYELSRDFYCGVLGFIEIPRPAFENEGVWLYGFGLSLHLIKSRYPEKRLLLKGRRIEHFEEALPNVDHMAFITSNLNEVEKQLREHNVFYKRFGSHKTNIHQIFLFDPDGNVIEISNCAPPVGETTCPRVVGMGGPASPQSRL
ncbi:hypothetical protein NSK_008186 [Nannochloropsis salina CCMP1776]|uniref:VOC domain-containing protein n=2 Tax=Monodopsidaceae TaxID=425072 RepID=A0A4D9CS97_9STRA|nr:hypothetical protein NSK_008186 [Nannochloropsis salina CCMP1776]|eukprot:TFJ80445.1 hypothetical protein NSK_008186 [Nannochloropsis salina CCMP1776]